MCYTQTHKPTENRPTNRPTDDNAQLIHSYMPYKLSIIHISSTNYIHTYIYLWCKFKITKRKQCAMSMRWNGSICTKNAKFPTKVVKCWKLSFSILNSKGFYCNLTNTIYTSLVKFIPSSWTQLEIINANPFMSFTFCLFDNWFEHMDNV